MLRKALLTVLFTPAVVAAQVILPAPSNLQSSSRVSIYGMGSTTTKLDDLSNIADDPAGKLLVSLELDNVFLVASFNKATGDAVPASDYEANDLRSSDLGEGASMISASWIFLDKTPVPNQERTQVALFGDYHSNKSTVLTDAGQTTEREFGFEHHMANVGLSWTYFYYKGDNRFRFILGAAGTLVDVTKSTAENFRAATGIPDLADRFIGATFKAAFQINALTASFECGFLSPTGGLEGGLLDGGHCRTVASVSGKVVSF